jgi:hypothetical protein
LDGGIQISIPTSFPEDDIFIYVVSKGNNFRMQFFVLGVVASAPMGVLCNVDFVHVVWNYFEFTSHKRYAVTLIPLCFTEGEHKLLCLKYYRVASDGWNDGTNCASCTEEFRLSVREQVGCLLSLIRNCLCSVCVR